jgi:hypothetical protein
MYNHHQRQSKPHAQILLGLPTSTWHRSSGHPVPFYAHAYLLYFETESRRMRSPCCLSVCMSLPCPINFLMPEPVFISRHTAGRNGRAVKGMNCLPSLGRWDHGFESHSRHGCLCAFIVCLCCPVCR